MMRAILFARPPIPGRCKTRLAAKLGAARAAELSAAFVRDALHAARAAGLAPELHAAEEPDHPFFASLGVEVVPQVEGDLGGRMAASLERALPAMIVGTDAPGMPPWLTRDAARRLETADLVMVPVGDGGYALVAARGPAAARVLRDAAIRWSSAHALADTLRAAAGAGLRHALTSPWLDVDRAEDLPALEALVSARPDLAPHTAALLGFSRVQSF